MIWGTKCTFCGNDVFILQEENHPWFATNTVHKVKCEVCETVNCINQREAERFYNSRIYEQYEHISGNVVDIGCGGGLITNYLDTKKEVDNIYAIDSDYVSKDSLNLSDKIHFIHGNVEGIDKLLDGISIDYMVSRDVVMYIENLPLCIQKASHIVQKGMVIVGWYNPTLSRVKNDVHPEEIKTMLTGQGFEVEYKELNWYKWGYKINANWWKREV